MKIAIALLSCAAAWAQTAPKPPTDVKASTSIGRPTFEAPADLQLEYFRQAWQIERAVAKQNDAIRKIQTACEKALAEAKFIRDESGDYKWVCTPKKEEK